MERVRGAEKESAGWINCSDVPVRKTTWRMSATCILLAPAVPSPLSACLVVVAVRTPFAVTPRRSHQRRLSSVSNLEKPTIGTLI